MRRERRRVAWRQERGGRDRVHEAEYKSMNTVQKTRCSRWQVAAASVLACYLVMRQLFVCLFE